MYTAPPEYMYLCMSSIKRKSMLNFIVLKCHRVYPNAVQSKQELLKPCLQTFSVLSDRQELRHLSDGRKLQDPTLGELSLQWQVRTYTFESQQHDERIVCMLRSSVYDSSVYKTLCLIRTRVESPFNTNNILIKHYL